MVTPGSNVDHRVQRTILADPGLIGAGPPELAWARSSGPHKAPVGVAAGKLRHGVAAETSPYIKGDTHPRIRINGVDAA
ncbi:MAG: hypothetical protein J2P17_31130 [Mycobacterium sp.]|nr:hypothetical protein [Mycobacterium sp.]